MVRPITFLESSPGEVMTSENKQSVWGEAQKSFLWAKELLHVYWDEERRFTYDCHPHHSISNHLTSQDFNPSSMVYVPEPIRAI